MTMKHFSMVLLLAGVIDAPMATVAVPAFAANPWLGPVPTATCGPGSRTETGLQGSTTLAERYSGASAQSYHCNLELVGQVQSEGASWQMAYFDHCAYYAVANTPEQQHKGTVVVDVSDTKNPKIAGYLDTPTMDDPWESLHVNQARKLLGGVEAENGTGLNGGFEIYDISQDCAKPVLKSSIVIPDSTAHAGNWSPDGNFFYVTQGFRGVNAIMPIVDTTDASKPKWIMNWKFTSDGRSHDTNMNDAGTRLYAPQPGNIFAPKGNSSEGPEGLVILDTSDVANHVPNPQIRTVSTFFWKDGGQAQQTLPVTIGGKPYVIFTQETSSGAGGPTGRGGACAQNLPPFGFTKIVDISDEKKPTLTANVMLQVHDPKYCVITLSEATNPGFVYDSHYCNVDNQHDARLLACGYFEAGIRVFDIRDPYSPKEVAYYKPPAQGTKVIPGSNLWNRSGRGGLSRTADWAGSFIRVVKRKATGDVELWFTSQDNGFQVVKFTNLDQAGGKDLYAIYNGDDVP